MQFSLKFLKFILFHIYNFCLSEKLICTSNLWTIIVMRAIGMPLAWAFCKSLLNMNTQKKEEANMKLKELKTIYVYPYS